MIQWLECGRGQSRRVARATSYLEHQFSCSGNADGVFGTHSFLRLRATVMQEIARQESLFRTPIEYSDLQA